MKVLTDDQIAALTEVKNENKITSVVPPGYVAIELSTKGKLGAPRLFHIRNFRTTDLVSLSLTSQPDLPEIVANILDDMIFEEDVSVRDWHENEVIEFLVRLFMIFFSPSLEEVEFYPTEEDWDFLKESVGIDKFNSMKEDYEAAKWVPRTTIDLSRIETYDLDDTFSSTLKIKSNKTNLKASFTFPKFGDILIVKKFLRQYYEKEDKQFASITRTLTYQKEMEDSLKKGGDVSISKIPQVPQAELIKFTEYEMEKALTAVELMRGLHFLEFDGKNYKNASLEEKLEVAKDPRVDLNLSMKVEDYFKNLNFGINDKKIVMQNPITKESCERRYSFRLVDILQAIRSFKNNEYDIDIDN